MSSDNTGQTGLHMSSLNRKVLMVAYHYPPIQASSGVHRTLAFSRYLPLSGWDPTVLTVTRNALTDWRNENENMVPEHVNVIRAVAVDAHRHLSINGKYLDLSAIPDRWSSWVIPAVIKGMIFIKLNKPALLYSTYPIASAHLVTYLLHKLTGLPWVADFRDPMLQENFPRDEYLRKSYRWIEEKTISNANKMIFTTPGAISEYQKNYPEISTDKYELIENGYDESNFKKAEDNYVARSGKRNDSIKLLHSGLIYRTERDPANFFEAIKLLKEEGIIDSKTFQVVLRASGDEVYYAGQLKKLAINDIVILKDSLDYQNALIEMMESDGLLLLQAGSCNHQIPAKLYEYFRCNKPIIALTDKSGDTAKLMGDSGIDSIAALNITDDIYRLLKEFILNNDRDKFKPSDVNFVKSKSRQGRAMILGDIFNKLIN